MLRYVNYGVVFQEIPDETTLSINLSNCPIKCKDCHSKYLWQDVGTELDNNAIDDLLDKYDGDITCVCIMGGDSEPQSVNLLAAHIRATRVGLKIGWYSGRDKLSEHIDKRNFDYIKVGPYIKECGGLKSRTTNQRLYRMEGSRQCDITDKFWNNG